MMNMNIHGRRAMTQSARQQRQIGHIPKKGRGRGKWRTDDEGNSQATQAVNPTQVGYLNYQTQVFKRP